MSMIDFDSATAQCLDIGLLAHRGHNSVHGVGQHNDLLWRMLGDRIDKVDRVDKIIEPRHVAQSQLLIVPHAHGDITRGDHRASDVGPPRQQASDKVAATRKARKIDLLPPESVLESAYACVDQGDLAWAATVLMVS